ncbi:hypothetical protein HDV02_002858 [Globomyces sp. JEL0801]|nr:hypothetical protein HDV02_002858 [Globomyces sp. JEL0801]
MDDWMIYDNRDFVMPKMKDMQLEDISDPKVSVESVSDQLGDSVIRIPSKEGESKSNKKTHHHSHKSAGEPIRTHKENSAKSNHDQIDDTEKLETDTQQIPTVSVNHSTPDEQHVYLNNVESVVTDQPNTEELLGSNPQELNVDANNDTNSLNKDVSEPIDSNAPGSGPLTTENTNVKLKTIENENYENVNQSSTTDSLIWPYLFFGGFFLVTFSLIVHKRRFYRYKLVELEKEEF